MRVNHGVLAGPTVADGVEIPAEIRTGGRSAVKIPSRFLAGVAWNTISSFFLIPLTQDVSALFETPVGEVVI